MNARNDFRVIQEQRTKICSYIPLADIFFSTAKEIFSKMTETNYMYFTNMLKFNVEFQRLRNCTNLVGIPLFHLSNQKYPQDLLRQYLGSPKWRCSTRYLNSYYINAVDFLGYFKKSYYPRFIQLIALIVNKYVSFT